MKYNTQSVKDVLKMNKYSIVKTSVTYILLGMCALLGKKKIADEHTRKRQGKGIKE